MPDILVNIIPFEGSPFKEPIYAWMSKSKEKLKWNDIGWIIRRIRERIRNSDCLVFQYGRNMISTKNLSKNQKLTDLIEDFEESEKINVTIEDLDGQEIIRRLIGEAISQQLRHNMRQAYKIEERPNAIYYASDPTEIVGFGELDVYKGFIFVPLIQKGGTTGVMLDPRSRYHTKENIRKFIDPENQETWIKELEYDHVDICPVSWCEEKKDPLSSCTHSGSGKSLKIRTTTSSG